ncbi:MAG: hypothetical protein QS721_11675 [Candidatus Endonucleobacter sp. (ex Gigantidas childressi)]|nr:hypothetical protein [Candidatus Endonucleobacter sp. (ex Gigantidas childressi)]
MSERSQQRSRLKGDWYKLLLSEVQRAGLIKSFGFRIGPLQNHCLLAIDGTGVFHTFNNKKPCQECCTKNNGKTNEAHYHQMIAKKRQ